MGEMIGRGDFANVIQSGSYLTSRVGKKALKKSRKPIVPLRKGHFIKVSRIPSALSHQGSNDEHCCS